MMIDEMAVVYRGLATSVYNRWNVRRKQTGWMKNPPTIMPRPPTQYESHTLLPTVTHYAV